MEAITKKGKVIRGRIAEIFVKKGIATPVEDVEKPAPKKKAPAKRKPTAKKK